MMPMAAKSGLRLSALLRGIPEVAAGLDCVVTGPCIDSRRVSRGGCFFALRGPREYGANDAQAAVNRGAIVALVDAGDKGHECVREVTGERLPFRDRAVIGAALAGCTS